jgi:hypothetical protein
MAVIDPDRTEKELKGVSTDTREAISSAVVVTGHFKHPRYELVGKWILVVPGITNLDDARATAEAYWTRKGRTPFKITMEIVECKKGVVVDVEKHGSCG